MARTTKIELVQINSRLASENADLRTQLADLQLNLEMVTSAHADAERELSETRALLAKGYELVEELSRPAPARPARQMPQWQVERGERMAAARALAMQQRCVVRA